MVNMPELGGVGSQLIYVKRYENDIKATIDKMPANKAAQYSHLSANLLYKSLKLLDGEYA